MDDADNNATSEIMNESHKSLRRIILLATLIIVIALVNGLFNWLAPVSNEVKAIVAISALLIVCILGVRHVCETIHLRRLSKRLRVQFTNSVTEEKPNKVGP